MNPLWEWVSQRANHHCEYCHAPEKLSNFAFVVEHIYPRSRGGSDRFDNLALACYACNLFKSDRIEGIDEIAGSPVRLFNPRIDDWSSHFLVSRTDGTLMPIDGIALVTERLLRFNTPRAIIARRNWMRLGEFPC